MPSSTDFAFLRILDIESGLKVDVDPWATSARLTHSEDLCDRMFRPAGNLTASEGIPSFDESSSRPDVCRFVEMPSFPRGVSAITSIGIIILNIMNILLRK
jgi:hypothetical protein